jgi:hypothetical protein
MRKLQPAEFDPRIGELAAKQLYFIGPFQHRQN